MNLTKPIRVLFGSLLLTFASCSDSLDFDQVKDLNAEPEVEASLIVVEVPESFINSAAEVNFFDQNFNFDAFNSNIFANRVLEGTITYVVENTTSKEITITIEFLDESGAILDTEVFNVDPAPTVVLQREIAYGGTGRSIDIIKNTGGLRVSSENLGDTTSTSTLPDARITIKSKGKFKVRVI